MMMKILVIALAIGCLASRLESVDGSHIKGAGVTIVHRRPPADGSNARKFAADSESDDESEVVEEKWEEVWYKDPALQKVAQYLIEVGQYKGKLTHPLWDELI